MSFFDLSTVVFNEDTLSLLGHSYAAKYCALPISQKNDHLFVVIPKTNNISEVIQDLSDITGLFIVPNFALAQDIRFYINKVYSQEQLGSLASQFLVEEQLKARNNVPSDEFLQSIQSAPAVGLLDSLIETGVLNRASDIHIEPFGNSLRTRYRVDGKLITHGTLDLSMLQNIISRLNNVWYRYCRKT